VGVRAERVQGGGCGCGCTETSSASGNGCNADLGGSGCNWWCVQTGVYVLRITGVVLMWWIWDEWWWTPVM
jgi:hypothetical protein